MTLQASTIQNLRAQFPALHQPTPDGSIPVFLDNPAGTQVPQVVIDAVTNYYVTMNANAGGAFATSQRSDAMVQATRESMADFLNAPSADEIVFGPNSTTLNFGLSRAIGKTLHAGDEIVLTKMDHDGNIAPWLTIAEDYGLTVRWVDIHTEDCTLDLDGLEAALTDRTRIVACVHASNAVGTINPIARIGEMAHAAGALFVVDAVQSTPHIPIDVQALGCDFLFCSTYKFFGPHLGVLWGKYELLESLPVYKVRPAKNKAPYRWETGTPSFETLSGLNATIGYLAEIGATYGADIPTPYSGRRHDLKAAMVLLSDYERGLVTGLIAGLQTIQGLEIKGITDPARYRERVPTVVFSIEGHSPSAVAEYLAQQDIYVWNGHFYAPTLLERLGKQEGGLVRVGLAHYNVAAEIDRLIEVLQEL